MTIKITWWDEKNDMKHTAHRRVKGNVQLIKLLNERKKLDCVQYVSILNIDRDSLELKKTRALIDHFTEFVTIILSDQCYFQLKSAYGR